MIEAPRKPSSKTYLVARREYVENLRTKAFWIGILAFPVILTLSIAVPKLLAETKDVRRYAVLDLSGDARIFEAVLERADSPDLGRVYRRVRELQRDDPQALEAYPESLRRIAPSLAAMSAQQAAEVGARIDEIDDPGSKLAAELEKVAPGATAKLASEKDAIRAWWRGLPAAEASELAPTTDRSRYQLVTPDLGGADPEATLKRMLDEQELFAYFVIGPDPVASAGGCKYVSKNRTDTDLKNWFTQHVNKEIHERRFRERKIDAAAARAILEPVAFEDIQVAAGGRESKVTHEDVARQWVPVVFVYLLWMAIFTIAQMLLTNTIEEKSNRIIEVLLSSVSPQQLMTGKILGIAATGLTVVLSWIVCIIIGVGLLPKLLDFELTFDLSFILTDPAYLASFFAYFLMGYFLYAALFVAMGSVCNSLKEAQNLMTPLTIVLFLPFFLMVPIGMDPNGLLARVVSYVPLLTPFVMMNRSAGPPTTMEYVVTSLILVATTLLTFRAAAKVFRIGILMTGKPPRLGEILRWVTASSATRTPRG
jgi:ABC-2 type transport system permease protein